MWTSTWPAGRWKAREERTPTPLFDFEKLRGNTTRHLVSQVHLWLQATLRLGIPDLYTVQWIYGNRGVLVVSTGQLKNVTFSIRGNALDRMEVTGPGNIKEWVIEFADYRSWPFGSYPGTLTRCRIVRPGVRLFDKRFHIHQFEWWPEPLEASAFLPASNPFVTRGSVTVPEMILYETTQGWVRVGGGHGQTLAAPAPVPAIPGEPAAGGRSAWHTTLLLLWLAFALGALGVLLHPRCRTRGKENPP